MVPVEVMCSLSKVAIQDQPLCLGVMTVSIEKCPKAVGSEAYVHLVTFAAYDAVNEGCVFPYKCFMERIYGVSDTVEKRTCLPLALGQTLQRLSAHRIILDSILVMGMVMVAKYIVNVSDIWCKSSAIPHLLAQLAEGEFRCV